MPIEEIPIHSPIEAKIAWAQGSYEEIRDQLLRDETITHLLKAFEEAVRACHREMGGVVVAEECRDCEERGGGSCCGAGLEDKYSGVILLINLMLNAAIPNQRHDPAGCFFLGPNGCLLIARHVICINYLCSKITNRIGTKALSGLRDKEGVQLELLFLLQERIKKRLRA